MDPGTPGRGGGVKKHTKHKKIKKKTYSIKSSQLFVFLKLNYPMDTRKDAETLFCRKKQVDTCNK